MSQKHFACLLFAIIVVLGLVGCRTGSPREEIPRYAPMSIERSMAIIELRGDVATDVTGQGTLTFIGADGRSVRLDTVFVLAPPDRARVRAWKFSRAVFDLTRTNEGVWLYLPRGDDRADELTESARNLGDAIGEWLNLSTGRLDVAEGQARIEGDEIIVQRPMRDGLTLRATIDRATLTPRRYEGLDDNGKVQFRMILGRYQQLGATVWPAVVVAQSESGTVRVEARELDLNVAPPTAFTPARRAEKLVPSEPR